MFRVASNDSDLLDTEDTRGLADVLLDLGADISVGCHGVGSPVAGLHEDLDTTLVETRAGLCLWAQ